MTANLFDVNFLIALAWPNHMNHGMAVRWFKTYEKQKFATCPITETGFVRISMNPLVVGEAADAATAIKVLSGYRTLPGHVFWADELSASEALSAFPGLSGHRQVTDAYLLALAARNGGRLVTFDRGMAELAGAGFTASLVVVD